MVSPAVHFMEFEAQVSFLHQKLELEPILFHFIAG